MKAKSCYLLYLVTQPNGFCTGRLLHRWPSLFDTQIAAWGFSEAEVAAKIAAELEACNKKSERESFLFKEAPKLHALRVDVHLLTRLGKVQMVGERTAPLRLYYGLAPADSGYLLMVPRFDWVLEVEKAALGATLVRQQLAAFLAGAAGDQLLAALPGGEEKVVVFEPGGKRVESNDDDDLEAAFPETLKVAENWSAPARGGGGPPLLDLFAIEAQRHLWDNEQPASLLLVGPPGVGKTSWVRLLAKLFERAGDDDDDPRFLWASSAEQLLAGMSYLGDWEERCLKVVRELEGTGHYLYLGRLLPLAEKRGHSAILEVLTGFSRRELPLSLIAECTEEELEQCRRLVPSALQQFRQIRLAPPSLQEMPRLIALYLERRQLPPLASSGVVALGHLLEAYQRSSSFPGKAFTFLERWREDLLEAARRAGAKAAPQPFSRREVEQRFCQVTGLAADLVAPREATTVAALAQKLARGVVGQEAACLAGARVLARFRGGVYDPEKPLGTLLFVGPTGVGKTELAKQLARTLFGDEKRLLRFDMSEYHLPGAARRLLAVGRGIRSLAQNVRQEPLSVLLFDEIEKAHAEVFDLLLGALGEGRLKDEEGGHVDLTMTVVVLTSNLGVRPNASPGFGEKPALAADYEAAIRRFFRPELVNRLDEIVPFAALELAAIEKIVELQVAKIRQRPGFKKRGIRLHLEPSARAWLARHGFDPRYGARPLLRLLEAKVVAPLATLLAENPQKKKLEVYLNEKNAAAPSANSLVLALEP